MTRVLDMRYGRSICITLQFAIVLAQHVNLFGPAAQAGESDSPNRRKGSTLYDPTEAYDVNLPVYPVDYTDEQKQAQREAGIALVKEVNEAMRNKKPEYRAKPGVYRLPKSAEFEIRDLDRFALHLPDCELILESAADRSLFKFGKARSFTLVGPLKIDFDPLPESQGRITASDFGSKQVTVEVLPGYRALAPGKKDKEEFYTYSPTGIWLPNASWSGFEWKDATLSANGRTLTMRVGKDVPRDYWEMLYKPGNLVAIGHAGCGVLFCIWPDQLGELVVQDVEFYGGGFGWGNATGDSTLTRVRGMRRTGTSRLQGGGGWQSGKRQGRVTLDSCEFRTSYDDILDLSSGSMDMVWQQESPRQWVIWSNAWHHYEQDKPGDAFVFYAKDFTPIADAKLVSVERIPDETAKPWIAPAAELVRKKLGFKDHTGSRVFWRLTFDKDLALEPGTLVEDVANRQMEVVMRNCTWYDGGVRVMIQSGRKVEITNNHFVRIASGLNVCTDAWWWQGETCHDVLIADNVFIDCSYGQLWGSGNAAISVHGGSKPIAAFPERYPNDDIVIRGNRFEGSSSGAIIVQNSDRVKIVDNECRRLYQRKKPGAAIAVTGCGHVAITGNRVEDCPAPAVKTEWVNGLDCRDNMASNIGKAGANTVAIDIDRSRAVGIEGNRVERSTLDAVVRLNECGDAKVNDNAADVPTVPHVIEGSAARK